MTILNGQGQNRIENGQRTGGETPPPPTPDTATVSVFGANWVRAVLATSEGLGACTHRSWYLRVDGPNVYFWHTMNDGSTAPGVDAGDDPGNYVSELDGYIGIVVPLPNGLVTAEERAALIAAEMEAQEWCDSATLAVAANPNGSWSFDVVGEFDDIAVGSRSWDDRGASGVWGSRAYRRGAPGEVPGALDIDITANIASACNPVPAGARVWGVSLLLSSDVNAAVRPRLYLRAGGTPTDPAGSTMIFDFGQIPASEIVAGAVAMVTLEPTQTEALSLALEDAVGEQLWLCAKSVTGTGYFGCPTGGGWEGNLADADVQVDNVTSSDPTTPAPAVWDSSDPLNFPFLVPMRLHYEVDPAGTGESHPTWGTGISPADFPNPVTLPDTETAQTSLSMATLGHQGAQVEFMTMQIDSGVARADCTNGGDVSDPDDPSLDGATTLYDFGESDATGLYTWVAPTGDDAVYVDEVFSARFKGTGAVLRGDVFPADNTVIEPNDFVRLAGANLGQNPFELDYAAPGGNPATPLSSPISDPATQPFNLPGLIIGLRRMPDVVEVT